MTGNRERNEGIKMTERIFKSMMNRIPEGEYYVDAYGRYEIYKMICPKSYRDTSKLENNIRYYEFMIMFDELKYGFEYMFKGKIRYLGTNNLNTLIVKK